MTLTREEILAMEPGAEFNRIIAKELFKATIINKLSSLSDKTFYLLVAGEDFNPIEKGKNLGNAWWRLSEELAWEACPRYSSDISAAWEVAEKLRQTHWIDISGGLKCELVSPYSCRVGKYGLAGSTKETDGETASEAICKAALLAVLNL